MKKIDFVYSLGSAIAGWPASSNKVSLGQLATMTGASQAHLLQFFSESLGGEMRADAEITLEQARNTNKLLRTRLAPEIAQREAELERLRRKASVEYDVLMDRIGVMQVDRRWREAGATLEYFWGEYHETAAAEINIQLCSEIIRCGIKSEQNLQELGRWLQKGTEAGLAMRSRYGTEQALDLIDAYGTHFVTDRSSVPYQIHPYLEAIIRELDPIVAQYELWNEYKQLLDDLLNISAL